MAADAGRSRMAADSHLRRGILLDRRDHGGDDQLERISLCAA
jgi:hypothetical protein